jgi:hypothetical protein
MLDFATKHGIEPTQVKTRIMNKRMEHKGNVARMAAEMGVEI